jgi:hypothetical protein
MKTSDLSRCGFHFYVVAIMLAGCSNGSQSGFAPSAMTSAQMLSSTQRTSTRPHTVFMNGSLVHGDMVGRMNHRGFGPNAPFTCNGPCLYVSDLISNEVDVYKYKAGTVGAEVALLFGFNGPDGICVGRSKIPGPTMGKNLVWIVNNGGSQIFGYQYGQNSPTYIVNVFDPDPGYIPVGCSVDPKTGDLAVTDVTSTVGGLGNVAVFTPSEQAVSNGPPSRSFTAPNIYNYYRLGYDNRGNLWVDGLDSTQTTFEFAKCPPGCAEAKPATLNQPITFPGQVQWDNEHEWLEVNNVSNGIAPSVGYEFTMRGTKGTLAHTTPLKGSGDVGETWQDLKNGKLIAADDGHSEILIYNYPAGGEPLQHLGVASALGVALLP